VPSLRALNDGRRNRLVVQQDSDPKHGAGCVIAMGRAHITRLLQLPRSPDLNPLENVWKTMKDRVAAHSYLTQCCRSATVRDLWDVLKMAHFRAASIDMPRRPRAVIRAGGAVTRF